jgi:hypothetical protein
VCTAAPGEIKLAARCDSRRFVLFGLLSKWTRRVDVRLADGRVLRARTVPPHGRLRREGRAFLMALPRAALPREIQTRAPTPKRGRLRPPPATSQCGYVTDVYVG